jgi:hypothetical protein
MIKTELRGAFHRTNSAQANVLGLQAGSRLWLTPEPTNRFDPNAIQVWQLPPELPRSETEHFLGYIAKEDCEDVLPYLEPGDDEDEGYQCRVAEVRGLKPELNVGFGFEFSNEESQDGGSEDGEA